MYLSLYKEIIFGAQSSTVTNKIKQQHWDEIVAAINQQCPSQEPRDREETKKKWNNLASDARKNLKDHKKSLEQTGIIYSFNLRHLQFAIIYVIIRKRKGCPDEIIKRKDCQHDLGER